MTNKEIFTNIVNTYIKRDGIVPLMEWLETTDFFTAPASTRYHLSVEGGLLHHSLNVYNRLVKLYISEYGAVPEDKRETLAIIGLFHDFCKIYCYKPDWKNVKVYKENGSKTDNGGRFDWETQPIFVFEERLVFGYHGVKSAYLISACLRLTDEEYISIANHMGAHDRAPNDYSLGKLFEQYNLAFLLHTADCLATYIDEREDV